MKRTLLKQIGKQGRINLKANRIINKRWQEEGIDYCEIGLENCLGSWTLQNVHRNKRIFYKENLEINLWDKREVVRGCQNCHDKVENNKELREEVFKRLRDI